jgi:DNA adenine methylase
MDAADYLRTELPGIDKPFVNLDPPYFLKGEGLYENFYEYENHIEVANLVRRVKGGHWLVSYDNRAEIVRLYKDYRRRTHSLAYSAAERYRGSEAMFFSPDLNIPRAQSPASVPAATIVKSRLRHIG